MDSWRDTTIQSEDEDESTSEDSDQVNFTVPMLHKKPIRPIIYSDESDAVDESILTKTENGAENSQVVQVEEDFGNENPQISTMQGNISDNDMGEETVNDFEDDFLRNNKFNSTFVDNDIVKRPQMLMDPEEPAEEEEQELLKSIWEQSTVVDKSNSLTKSVIDGSVRSSRGTMERHSNIKKKLSENIIEATEMSVEMIQSSLEEIIISDEDEDHDSTSNRRISPFKKVFPRPDMSTNRQPTLPEMFKMKPMSNTEQGLVEPDSPVPTDTKRQVSHIEHMQLKQHLEQMYYEKRKLDMALNTIQLSQLPDKGQALINKQNEMDLKLKDAQDQLANAIVSKEPLPQMSWKGLEAGTTAVQPRTFGKQAMQTYNTEKALTLDRLHNLHASLKTCPTSETLADDPRGLKVPLMLHQKHALAWLLWRELQKPAGGILADDMGLGKTLTMISLIVAHNQMREGEEDADSEDENETEEEQRQFKYDGGTLVVCPASLIGQWANEVQDKVEGGLLSVETYHGPKRETKTKRLAKYDLVVTTYAICQSEGESDTPLYRVKWERIILDEAHQIRNHKSKTSLAVFRLGGKRRWALTGTPVQNKEMDLFALLKFLRCSPFDDVAIFKRWISSKSGGGHQRLHTVLSSMLLRRTKEQLKEMEQLTCLPDREWQLVEIKMQKDEMEVYQKVLLFSKTLFAQFLHQRAERDADAMDMNNGLNDPSEEYYKMHKKLLRMNKLPQVKQSDILVLLLRLRQICCHPTLITAMLDNVADLGSDGDEDTDTSIDLLEQLNKLNIQGNDETAPLNISDVAGHEDVGLAEASRNLLNPSNPIFEKQRPSSKIQEVLKLLQEFVIPQNDKAIIVSQWPSFLHLLVPHLDELNITYCRLDGTVPVKARGELVCNFNNPESGVQIMLLSLTAGGVGLNLVGANHLIFVDLHWNPQLELQAQDRIYRVGQRKKVFVYKLMTLETIEQRIKCLQDRKKEIADSMLKGSKMQHSKLTLDDLKMLFNM